MDGSHFITSEHSTGDNVTIFAGNGGSKAVRSEFGGTAAASVSSDEEKYMIAQRGGYIIWGPIRTSAFNDEGDRISGRVLDYALHSSSVKP
jgi:hypothetical protein